MLFTNSNSIRRKTKAAIATCFFTLSGLLLHAQTCSLEDAVRTALTNNKQMQNEKLNVTSAAYRVAEAKSALLPRVDVMTQYQYYLDLPAQYAPASNFGGPEDQYSKMTMNVPQTMNASVQVTQIIHNREATMRIESAKLAMDASKIKAGMTKEDLVYNVTATYFTIQVLQDNLARLVDNINNLKKTVSINEVLKDNDLIAENVHNRLLINLENLNNEYENLLLSLDNNLTLLKYLMNICVSDSIHVAPFEYAELVQQAGALDFSQRPDLQFQQAQITIAEHEMKSIQARYMPVVNATFSSGFTGYNDAFAPYEQINNDLIGNSYFALNMKVPLFAGFQKKIQLSEQKINIENNRNTLSLMQLNAEKEVRDAQYQYKSSRSQLSHTKNSLDLAQQLFDTAQNDYANGIITITDLLNAQNDLTDARTNYSSSLLQVKLAELSIQKAYGLL